MKLCFSKIVLMISLFFPIALCFAVDINDAGKHVTIVVIHSYAPDFKWTMSHDAGIKKSFYDYFGDNPDCKIFTYFLDGKRFQEDSSAIQKKVRKIKSDILRLRPQGVILTDDLAFKNFYKFLKEKNIWISFSGINNSLEEYGYSAGEKGITGTLERYNFPVVVKIIKKLRTSIQKIVFLSDKSITSDGLVSSTKLMIDNGQFKSQGVDSYEFVQTEYFDQLKAKLSGLNPQNTAVIILANYTIRDSNNNYVHYSIIDDWIAHNTNLIVSGILGSQVKGGRLLSLSSSPVEMGTFCASNLFKAIVEKKDPSFYGIRNYMPLELILNEERAGELNIKLPFELLAYAKNSKRLMEQ